MDSPVTVGRKDDRTAADVMRLAPGARLIPSRPVDGGAQGDNRFTLVELLVVIAVLLALASLLLPQLTRAIENSRRVRCASNLKQQYASWAVYAEDANDGLPANDFYNGLSGPNINQTLPGSSFRYWMIAYAGVNAWIDGTGPTVPVSDPLRHPGGTSGPRPAKRNTVAHCPSNTAYNPTIGVAWYNDLALDYYFGGLGVFSRGLEVWTEGRGRAMGGTRMSLLAQGLQTNWGRKTLLFSTDLRILNHNRAGGNHLLADGAVRWINTDNPLGWRTGYGTTEICSTGMAVQVWYRGNMCLEVDGNESVGTQYPGSLYGLPGMTTRDELYRALGYTPR